MAFGVAICWQILYDCHPELVSESISFFVLSSPKDTKGAEGVINSLVLACAHQSSDFIFAQTVSHPQTPEFSRFQQGLLVDNTCISQSFHLFAKIL
jgi:hypothetical protein